MNIQYLLRLDLKPPEESVQDRVLKVHNSFLMFSITQIQVYMYKIELFPVNPRIQLSGFTPTECYIDDRHAKSGLISDLFFFFFDWICPQSVVAYSDLLSKP